MTVFFFLTASLLSTWQLLRSLAKEEAKTIELRGHAEQAVERLGACSPDQTA